MTCCIQSRVNTPYQPSSVYSVSTVRIRKFTPTPSLFPPPPKSTQQLHNPPSPIPSPCPALQHPAVHHPQPLPQPHPPAITNKYIPPPPLIHPHISLLRTQKQTSSQYTSDKRATQRKWCKKRNWRGRSTCQYRREIGASRMASAFPIGDLA